MLKTILKTLLLLLLLVIAYLLLYPVPFSPESYTAPPYPGLEGDFAKNDKLQAAQKLLKGNGIGPEDIAMSPDSMLYTGYEDGRIIRFSLNGENPKEIANTGGRPLGMKFDAQGNLIIADEKKGLISMDSLGKIRVLTDSVKGEKIPYADDLDIASNGMIYFSDASNRHHPIIDLELWELQATGRLLSYNPTTKETKVELDNMRFANGVALGPNEEYVLVNETFGMVITKYWLKGPKKGQREIWVDKLPGFPDNITYNGKGTFWLAMPSLRVPEIEAIFEQPFLRKIIYRLPSALTGAEEAPPYGMLVGLDEEGNITHNFQDTKGGISYITSVNEFDGYLYIGSLKNDALGKLKLEE